MISFTGSTRTGRKIAASAAQSNLKNVALELGGKSPVIIFNDARLDQAIEETTKSILWNSGQTCIANSRIYVQEDVSVSWVMSKETIDGSCDRLRRKLWKSTKPSFPPGSREIRHKLILAWGAWTFR
jgi:delta 1-pyrroline-5-carboxylate dehydrogenase